MVIAGKIRGNAPQLGRYLLKQGENERITILDVDGRSHADAAYLKNTLHSMELTSELTRSSNSVYHAYINPNPEDTCGRAMSMEEWQQSVDILTRQLGYEDQRKIVVLHEKPGGRVHAHVVYERYNHERGVMATYEQNYKAHDRARAEIERKLSHKATPQKNSKRDQHKQTLTAIWQRTNTAEEFVSEAKAGGYKVAKGTDRPFKVIDANGVSFDLVRKLDGVKTSEVRQRFGDTELATEKQAIRETQSAKQLKQEHQSEPAQSKLVDAQQAKHPKAIEQSDSMAASSAKTPASCDAAQADARQKFLQNVKDIRERNRSLTREITMSFLIALRVWLSFKGHATPEQRALLKQQFTDNRIELVAPQEQKPPDRMLGFIEAAQFYKPT